MREVLVFFFLIAHTLLIAQKSQSDQLLYQDYKFENDSLILIDGIDENEYSIVNIKKDLQYDYNRHVFTNFKDGNYDKTKHWSVPIRIYIDKSVERTTKEDFLQFIKFLPKINRLSISVVGNIKEANYYITTVDKTLSDFDDEFYAGITYSLITDSSNKFSSGRLLFNPKQLKDPTIQKTKLKQFFFASLGAFCIRKELGSHSILSENYIPARTISTYDYNILSYHYGLYNKNPIGYPELKKLQKKIDTTTFTNFNGRHTLKL